ncbi:MAG: hypothetical protein LBR71_07765 [Synergistaceae bacterium]|jgi:hypothetical protein|nr:hypothetical protein [Synergistaceae bacterium]
MSGDTPPPLERFDYNNLWKTVLRRYFWDALEIFLPALYEAADRSQEPEFLEQELEKITLDLEGGPNRTDVLARIKLKGGGEELLLCHLEVQGKGGKDLPTRMYRYKQMIYLRYGKEPVGIVVITAPRPKREKTFYSSEQFGVKVSYEYANVVVMDLPDEALLSGENRIGLVLLALKAARKSGKDEGLKFRYLREISNLWAARGWNVEDKRILLIAVEYLIKLQDKYYSEQMIAHIKSLANSLKEEEKTMYTSIFERVHKEEGRMEGRMEGRAEGRAEVARNMLGDGLSVDKVTQYTRLPREEVERLLN